MPSATVARRTSSEGSSTADKAIKKRSRSASKIDETAAGEIADEAENQEPNVDAAMDNDEDNDPSFGASKTARGKRKAAASGNAKKKAKTTPKVAKCTTCKIPLDSPNATFYTGHPEGSVEEFIALTNPKLSIEVNEKGDAPPPVERWSMRSPTPSWASSRTARA